MNDYSGDIDIMTPQSSGPSANLIQILNSQCEWNSTTKYRYVFRFLGIEIIGDVPLTCNHEGYSGTVTFHCNIHGCMCTNVCLMVKSPSVVRVSALATVLFQDLDTSAKVKNATEHICTHQLLMECY